MSSKNEIKVTQEDLFEASLINLMNKAFEKCTQICLKPAYYTSSVPTNREKTCLSNCYDASIQTSLVSASNLSKITEEYK